MKTYSKRIKLKENTKQALSNPLLHHVIAILFPFCAQEQISPTTSPQTKNTASVYFTTYTKQST